MHLSPIACEPTCVFYHGLYHGGMGRQIIPCPIFDTIWSGREGGTIDLYPEAADCEWGLAIEVNSKSMSNFLGLPGRTIPPFFPVWIALRRVVILFGGVGAVYVHWQRSPVFINADQVELGVSRCQSGFGDVHQSVTAQASIMHGENTNKTLHLIGGNYRHACSCCCQRVTWSTKANLTRGRVECIVQFITGS